MVKEIGMGSFFGFRLLADGVWLWRLEAKHGVFWSSFGLVGP